jgi:hypothetical protein
MFSGFILLIHFQYDRLNSVGRSEQSDFFDIETAHIYFDTAEAITLKGDESMEWDVVDGDRNSLGYFVQTSPQSDEAVGYSGPTNIGLLFDNEDRLLDALILSSMDTPAHVKKIRESDSFFPSLKGRSKRSLANLSEVDGVSGATLTSLAIQESIVRRFGGTALPSPFPEPLDVTVAQHFFEDAHRIQLFEDFHSLWNVYDENDNKLGRLIRTTPSADSIRGYQGPTDCVVGIDLTGQILGIRPGESYDNEEYVYYVRVDDYFLKLFNKKSLVELARLDLKDAEVEGVSGATYTSMAIARGLVAAAQDVEHRQAEIILRQANSLSFAFHTLGTWILVLLGVLVGTTRLRGHQFVRIAFPMILVIFLGLINGDVLSQASLVGWARHGIPWDIAPGLIFMSLVALLIPITTRRNLYCHHICPHGAAQQLLRKVTRYRIRIPRKLLRWLVAIPGITAAACVVIAMTSPTFSLVDLEPFNAYVFRVAGWATLAIAIVGLILSLVLPMAYCRFGCPTGFVLNFLRKSSADQWNQTDWAALATLLVSTAIWGFTQ